MLDAIPSRNDLGGVPLARGMEDFFFLGANQIVDRCCGSIGCTVRRIVEDLVFESEVAIFEKVLSKSTNAILQTAVDIFFDLPGPREFEVRRKGLGNDIAALAGLHQRDGPVFELPAI